jgi:hypothetical protein
MHEDMLENVDIAPQFWNSSQDGSQVISFTLLRFTLGSRAPGAHNRGAWVDIPGPVWALCRREKSLVPARN